MNPRVSIIVPCYNTAQYVGETLESIFAQTYTDYEVVVVNDASPDTPELERAIAPWKSRIAYLRHAENQGLAGTRNTAISASRGELIALLDSDDIWEPNYLEVQVRKLDEDPSADIVYPAAFVFGDGPGAGAVFVRSEGDVTFASLVEQRCSVMVSVLARRSALERAGLFDASLRSVEDFDMWLRCVKSGSKIIYHREVLLRYRRRKGSLSSDPIWMRKHVVVVLKKMRTAVALSAEEREVLERAIHRYEGELLFHQGKAAFVARDTAQAIDYLMAANKYLKKRRISLIIALLRTAPRLAHAYVERLAR